MSLVGSLLFTLYITWSPWHYAGQNFGISVMLLRRRGVDVTPTLKRWLYTSFISSYALVALVMHRASASAGAGVNYANLPGAQA